MRTAAIGSFLTSLAIAAGFPASAAAGVRVVGAPEFRSWNTEHHFFEYASGFLHGTGGVTTGCLSAPIAFPPRSVLHSMTGHFYDNHAGFDFSVALVRKEFGNMTPAVALATVGTTGESTSLLTPVDSTIDSPVISAAHFYYLLTPNCMDSNLQRLYDVVFDLDEAIFVDGFESGGTTAWNSAISSGRVWVPGASFGSKLEPGWNKTFNPDWGTVTREQDGCCEAPCLVAPVEVPHGATVTAVFADLYDDRPDRGLEVTIRRAPMNSAVVPSTLATIASTGDAGWQLRSDLSIDNATIDNDTYWYWAEACVTGGNSTGSVDELTQILEIIYTLP